MRGVLPLGGEVGPASPELEEAVAPTVVPEPTTLVLVSLGMVGLVFAGRRRTAAHAIASEDVSY